ncbi:allantoate amidohydrolase [Vibrio sp. DW001]|uniref:allantoate amidohydrolase n=1 Tax=Vibrio sp. DW001 TaxID=2912315 RepID=UPI0023B04C26|nr:allantoate amidohydrolase [Vibrio sp. DW001]WED25314.1 allantoate amidohydrolase [Vibrio sp. DW001]
MDKTWYQQKLGKPTMDKLAITVMEYCQVLAKYTQTPGQMDRRYLTPEHKLTNEQIRTWADESHLPSWQDQAGNQWVRLQANSDTEQRIILGSHTDTVPNGGKYDGVLGVIAPLVLIKYFADNGIAFDFHVDVVGFGDEEGTRFGATLLGSSAISGKWISKWRELTDDNGVSLAQAMRDFALDVSKVSEAQIDSNHVIAYVELHIEQGPVLEEKDLPISAVNGIAGAKRFSITLEGKAGHAGTVPIASRQDALVSACQWITELNQAARNSIADDYPVLATVGKLDVYPGGVNVIPGCVNMSLDVRSINDGARDAFIARSIERLEGLASENGVSIKLEETHNAQAVSCEPNVTTAMVEVVEQIIGVPLALTSGAGHDAMVLADIVPTTMLFMRCKEGISHSPKESVNVEDVAVSLSALAMFINEKVAN